MRTIVFLCAVAGLAGCTSQPYPIQQASGTIVERILIQPTTDGYHLTFSKPTGEVTRRVWCDGFDSACIEAR